MQGAQVFQSKIILKIAQQMINHRGRRVSNNNIIHMDEKKHCDRTLAVIEQRNIGLGWGETKRLQFIAQSRIPRTG
jgi:hypothetical protein